MNPKRGSLLHAPRAVGLFKFGKVEQLRADFSENPLREIVARRTCFAVKQLFQSENAVGVSP
jgi:hypothetical protein